MDASTLSNIGSVGSLFGLPGQIASTFLNNAAQKQSTQENRDWELKMWQMNNDYNTPANQMQRLEAAGLNKNLMYGQGTVGNSSSVPAPSSPVNYKSPNLATDKVSALTAIQNLLNMREQGKGLAADAQNKQNAAIISGTLAGWASQMGQSSYTNANGQYGQSSNLWRLRDAQLSQAIANVPLTSANASNAQTLADLNSRLRQYNMTANDSIWARMGIPGENGSMPSGASLLQDFVKSLWKSVIGGN